MFVHLALSVLRRRILARVNEEIRKVLHLSDQVQAGDWYLYQNYTELRVSGCELSPYKLPKFLPMRIFDLEYIRNMLNMDEIHFSCQEEIPIQNQNSNRTCYHLELKNLMHIIVCPSPMTKVCVKLISFYFFSLRIWSFKLLFFNPNHTQLPLVLLHPSLFYSHILSYLSHRVF